MKSSVLIVEDEARIRDIVRDYFGRPRPGLRSGPGRARRHWICCGITIMTPFCWIFSCPIWMASSLCRRTPEQPGADPVFSLPWAARRICSGAMRWAVMTMYQTLLPGGAAGKNPGADPPEPGRASGTAHLRSDHSGYRQPALYGKWSAGEASAPGLCPAVLPAAKPGTGALPESASG